MSPITTFIHQLALGPVHLSLAASRITATALWPAAGGLTRQRVLLRSGLMLLALLMAETVPSFGKIMHLIGGTFTLMLTFILPSLLYIRLRGEYSGTSKHG